MSGTPAHRTAIYLKESADQPSPRDDECYYLLTGSGLFIGRNTPLQRSLVPARRFPGRLARQEPFLELSCPAVPADLLARVFAFFRTVAHRHGGEAVVLLAWDERRKRMLPVVPPQVATVSRGWRGEPYPIGLHYDVPPLPAGHRLLGDVHSHVFEPAYASATDVADETHSPGLHVVAGRVHRDPPELHVEYVVDGTRFRVPPGSVLDLEGYGGRRDDFDPAWLQRVRVEDASEHRRPRREGSSSDGDAGPGARPEDAT